MANDLTINLDFGDGVAPVRAAGEDPPEGVYVGTIETIEAGDTRDKKGKKLAVHAKITAPTKVGDEPVVGRTVPFTLALPSAEQKKSTNEFFLGKLGQLCIAAGLVTAEKWAALKGKTNFPISKLKGRSFTFHFLPGQPGDDLFSQVTPLAADEVAAARAGELKVRDGRKKVKRVAAKDALGEEIGGEIGEDTDNGVAGTGGAGGGKAGAGEVDDLFT